MDGQLRRLKWLQGHFRSNLRQGPEFRDLGWLGVRVVGYEGFRVYQFRVLRWLYDICS